MGRAASGPWHAPVPRRAPGNPRTGLPLHPGFDSKELIRITAPSRLSPQKQAFCADIDRTSRVSRDMSIAVDVSILDSRDTGDRVGRLLLPETLHVLARAKRVASS